MTTEQSTRLGWIIFFASVVALAICVAVIV